MNEEKPKRTKFDMFVKAPFYTVLVIGGLWRWSSLTESINRVSMLVATGAVIFGFVKLWKMLGLDDD